MTRENQHEHKATSFVMAPALLSSCSPEQGRQEHAAGAFDRTVLPVKEPPRRLYTDLDVRNAKAPERFEVKTPKGAPNVVIVLVDDMGSGASSRYGGPISMPMFERLAANGISCTRFHTTALSSPTRMALLKGHNHHSSNAGSIMETATTFPGNNGIRPQSITPVAEVLRQKGFSTAAFGKHREAPPWEISVSASFDRRPTGSGFDKSYRFIGGETNQWSPMIYDGVTQVETPKDPNYHFTTDMTNQAISWVRFLQALSPDKPFFMYCAPGAAHAPHHERQEYVDRYRRKVDQGWDKVREATPERQKRLGIVPQNTTRGPKPSDINEWYVQ